ncbi:MAG: hypothetical protein R2827_04975, partial [Bdellovibrionales bacterium]
MSALGFIEKVEQPLLPFIHKSIWQEVLDLKANPSAYKSVSEAFPLRYKLQAEGFLSEINEK